MSIGWYGKLPCAGDFVHRRLPYALVEGLDRWLQLGMLQLKGAHPLDWQQMFRAAPVWNCAIPGSMVGGGTTLIGVLAPSCDRVGREFPLFAGIGVEAEVDVGPRLARADAWLPPLGRIIVNAQAMPTTIDAFDRALVDLAGSEAGPAADSAGQEILEILNGPAEDVPTVPMSLARSTPWPELAVTFDAAGSTTYWWTNGARGSPLRGFASEVGLSPTLMLSLMRPLEQLSGVATT